MGGCDNKQKGRHPYPPYDHFPCRKKPRFPGARAAELGAASRLDRIEDVVPRRNTLRVQCYGLFMFKTIFRLDTGRVVPFFGGRGGALGRR